MDAWGGIDIIVNNAGYTWDSVIQKMTDEQWDAVMDVHVKAPFRILRAAAEPIRIAAKKEAMEGIEVIRKVVNILVDRRALRQCRPDQLFGRQVRHDRHDPDDGEGVGPLQGVRGTASPSAISRPA